MPNASDPFLKSLNTRILTSISYPSPSFSTDSDPITDCGVEVLSKLITNPHKVVEIAERELNVFPFSAVGRGWGRSFVDGCLGVAAGLIRVRGEGVVEGCDGKVGNDWLDEVVAVLDRALIISGGVGREELIWEVLGELRGWMKQLEGIEVRGVGGGAEEEEGADDGRARKRRKMSSSPTKNGKGRQAEEEEDYEHHEKEEDDDLLPLNPTPHPEINHPVPRLHCPSLTEFQKHMDTIRTPVVLTGIMDHWPALKQWKRKSYWMRETFGGRRLVPVEVGRSYTDEDWGQKIMPFGQFLRDYILREDGAGGKQKHRRSSSSRASREGGGRNAEDGGSDSDSPSIAEQQQTGYLAQHDLFHQIPSLRSAITVPDYCYLDPPPPEPGTPVYLSRLKNKNKNGSSKPLASHPSVLPLSNGVTPPDSEPPNSEPPISTDGPASPETSSADGIQTNIWFGPPWTITPLHHDPHHNILCQIVGAKYIRLYSPHDSHRLYPRSDHEPAPHLQKGTTSTSDANDSETGADQEREREREMQTIDMSNTSSIDFSLIETSPAEDWDAVWPGLSEVEYVECVPRAGEALYVPVGWWHYVRSCGTGVSVSWWWGG